MLSSAFISITKEGKFISSSSISFSGDFFSISISSRERNEVSLNYTNFFIGDFFILSLKLLDSLRIGDFFIGQLFFLPSSILMSSEELDILFRFMLGLANCDSRAGLEFEPLDTFEGGLTLENRMRLEPLRL